MLIYFSQRDQKPAGFLLAFIHLRHRKKIMLSWSLTFLILALIAGVLGFAGIAGAAAGIAKILFFVFLILLVVSAISRSMRGGTP